MHKPSHPGNKNKNVPSSFLTDAKIGVIASIQQNQIPPQSPFSAPCQRLGVAEGAPNCLSKPADAAGDSARGSYKPRSPSCGKKLSFSTKPFHPS